MLTGAQPEHRTVRVQYSDKQSFKTQAKALGIMEDLKVRASYFGIEIVVKCKKCMAILPNSDLI